MEIGALIIRTGAMEAFLDRQDAGMIMSGFQVRQASQGTEAISIVLLLNTVNIVLSLSLQRSEVRG